MLFETSSGVLEDDYHAEQVRGMGMDPIGGILESLPFLGCRGRSSSSFLLLSPESDDRREPDSFIESFSK